MERSLTGIKVVELATFVAAPSATRFFADQGADVIKVEALSGDGTRWAAESEGRPVFKDDMHHNLTFELENGNKKSICMNLKNPTCYEVLMKLIANADIFVTNWRPQALERMHLDYESLKEKYPKLVYASVTGYGEKGPDKDLPGYDFTAFWTRSGILGSLYDVPGNPMNLIPSMGDRATGMCLAAGILAALLRAQRTGKGEKVTCSLFGTAIYLQGTMMQTAQYGIAKYPMSKKDSGNPIMNCFITSDGRWIQMSVPIYDMEFKKVAQALDRPDWLEDARFLNYKTLKEGNAPVLYEEIVSEFKKRTAADLSERLKNAGIAFAVAQTWNEVLCDEQAWANDCFYKAEYKSGSVTCVAHPVKFEEEGEPERRKFPFLGEQSVSIMKELGYSDSVIDQLLSDKDLRCEHDI